MIRLQGRARNGLVAIAMVVTLMSGPVRGMAAPAPPTSPAQAVAAVRDTAPPSDPALEARVMAVSSELRCLVCQNQTVADSSAGLAVDLRQQVREMLRAGQSEQQVLTYMTDRYGDFVLYRPPVRSSTWLLWFGPAILLLAGLVTLVVLMRRRSRLPDHAFEDDPQDQVEAAR